MRLFKKNTNDRGKTAYTLFGIEIFKKKTENNVKKYYLFGIRIFKKSPSTLDVLNMVNESNNQLGEIKEKQANIFANQENGLININNRLENLQNELNNLSQKLTALNDVMHRFQLLTLKNFETQVLHQKTFGEYKNKFNGKDLVIVATGPTVNDYVPIKNALHISCNRAFMKRDIKFDFLFVTDFGGIKDYQKEFLEYGADKCVKFIGDHSATSIAEQVPESFIAKNKNVRRFKTTIPILGTEEIPVTLDIDIHPLWHNSIAHQAMQFALYTNPKRIYLVGCDCATTGYFIGNNDNSHEALPSSLIDLFILGWKMIKQFTDNYYPETEIISVNPVGLKGLFKDEYQKKQ